MNILNSIEGKHANTAESVFFGILLKLTTMPLEAAKKLLLILAFFLMSVPTLAFSQTATFGSNAPLPPLTCSSGSTVFDWASSGWANVQTQTATDGNSNTLRGSFDYSNLTATGTFDHLPNNGFTGGFPAEDVLRHFANFGASSDSVDMRFLFGASNTLVEGASFLLYDVDQRSNLGWRDAATIIGYNGGNPIIPSVVALGPAATVSGNSVAGNASGANNSGAGNVSVVFSQPIDSFSVVVSPGVNNTGNQGFAISDIHFCNPVIPATIVAIDDAPVAVDGATGATIPNVVTNDTLGGTANPAIGTDVTVNETGTAQDGATTLGLDVTPAAGSITFDPTNGEVSVAAGTTAGTYVFTYEICDVLNATNCDTAEVTLVVEIDALISEIDEDLIAILEEDLANTLTMQSRQLSGYSADALDRLRKRDHNSCLADVNARLTVENILFDTDKAIIKSQSGRTLDEIAAILISCPGSAFEIAGHTDSDASEAYNIDLSQRRVVAVGQALEQRGVDMTGYIARGYGESQPVASNATAAGKAQNRRVEFRSLDVGEGYDGPCQGSLNLMRGLSLKADDDGVIADGQFLRDEHDCITDRREVFEGSLSYTDTGQGQTQSAINLSYRREQYRGSDRVFGYFFGLYGSQSDVSSRASGEINGVGLNAGIYGAKRLQEDLFLDYYLGAAAGRHEFDLAFDRSVGTISATGDYKYLAGFAGAALSGEVDFGEGKVTPRIGFDYVYTAGTDVNVIAELGGFSEVGTLDLEAISGGRVFAELRVDRPVLDGTSSLWITPRVACYQSLGSLDGVCGAGGAIGIESVGEDSDLTYAFELDGEFSEDYSTGSIAFRAKHQLDLGVVSGDAGLNSNGNVTMGARFEMKF